VRLVADGERAAVADRDPARRQAFARTPEPNAPSSRLLAELTERETEIVALVGRGLSNHEIAEHLIISPATARTHVSRAMLKLGARDRAQLVVFAYETGLVSRSASPSHRSYVA
jgi:DNA-binding NarL/FixJ family response regulator